MAERTAAPSRSSSAQDMRARERLLLHELKDRSLWFVRVRWWIPPTIWIGLVASHFIGIVLEAIPLFLISVLLLACNLLFHRWHYRFVRDPELQTEDQLRTFTRWQVGLDFLVIFLLVHFSGGGASPLVFFFIFHIIFASILLTRRTAHAFAVAVALGMGVLTSAEAVGWLPHHPMLYRGAVTITLTGQALPALVTWVFFAVSVVFSSFLTTSIMEMVRRRILRLAELSEAVMVLNNRLRSLHTITHSIVRSRHIGQVLDLVCTELARVMEVQGISVKLLSEDGTRLLYAASHGLPELFAVGREVDVERSPLNRRIIDGEPFVTGQVTEIELFQLGEELSEAQVQSVLFVAVRDQDQVIGILGAYSLQPERFRQEDTDFLHLGGELVAIAMENARAYESIEELGKERERFMYRVAHNLRAPLAAMVSMIDVIQDGYTGGLNEAQLHYVQRIQGRARSLNELVDELMVLAAGQGKQARAPELVSLPDLVDLVASTFQAKANERQQRLEVCVDRKVPPVLGDGELLERMMENLVSNAIKYTPVGGRIDVTLGPNEAGQAVLVVKDTGIGIPDAAQSKLFTEFFRAENARAIEAVGTGLGLVIVRDIVEQHGGTVSLDSTENQGTTFTVTLPPVEPGAPVW